MSTTSTRDSQYQPGLRPDGRPGRRDRRSMSRSASRSGLTCRSVASTDGSRSTHQRATTGIALAPPPPDQQDVAPTQTGITLVTDDIDTTHAEMKSLGVDVDAEVSRMGDPVPPMFWFRDPTGHTLMVVEQR